MMRKSAPTFKRDGSLVDYFREKELLAYVAKLLLAPLMAEQGKRIRELEDQIISVQVELARQNKEWADACVKANAHFRNYHGAMAKLRKSRAKTRELQRLLDKTKR